MSVYHSYDNSLHVILLDTTLLSNVLLNIVLLSVILPTILLHVILLSEHLLNLIPLKVIEKWHHDIQQNAFQYTDIQ